MLHQAEAVSIWTETRVQQLRQFWSDGLSCSQIAAALDCVVTRNAVIGKVNRLGLPARKRKPLTILSRAEKARRQQLRRQHPQKRRPPTKVRERVRPVEFLGIRLPDLGCRQCRFPRGEGADITFCGQITKPGESFCPYCCGIVYQREAA